MIAVSWRARAPAETARAEEAPEHGPAVADRLGEGRRLAHLAEDLGLAEHHRLETAGDGEEVARRLAVALDVEPPPAGRARARAPGRRAPGPSGRRPPRRAAGGDLGAVAGREEERLGDRPGEEVDEEVLALLRAVGDPLAELERRAAVVDADEEERRVGGGGSRRSSAGASRGRGRRARRCARRGRAGRRCGRCGRRRSQEAVEVGEEEVDRDEREEDDASPARLAIAVCRPCQRRRRRRRRAGRRAPRWRGWRGSSGRRASVWSSTGRAHRAPVTTAPVSATNPAISAPTSSARAPRAAAACRRRSRTALPSARGRAAGRGRRRRPRRRRPRSRAGRARRG